MTHYFKNTYHATSRSSTHYRLSRRTARGSSLLLLLFLASIIGVVQVQFARADDGYESNDTQDAATELSFLYNDTVEAFYHEPDMVAGEYNADWYNITALACDFVNVTVEMTGAFNTFDVELYNETEAVVVQNETDELATSPRHFWTLTYCVPAPQNISLYLMNTGVSSGDLPYDVNITVTHNASTCCCTEDPYEDNDDLGTATTTLVADSATAEMTHYNEPNLVSTTGDYDAFNISTSVCDYVHATVRGGSVPGSMSFAIGAGAVPYNETTEAAAIDYGAAGYVWNLTWCANATGPLVFALVTDGPCWSYELNVTLYHGSATCCNAPVAPVFASITPNPSTTGNVTLDWSDPPAGQSYTYDLYLSTSEITTQNLGTLTPAITGINGGTFAEVEGLSSGTSWFAVVAKNASGATLSNSVSVTVNLPEEEEEEDFDLPSELLYAVKYLPHGIPVEYWRFWNFTSTTEAGVSHLWCNVSQWNTTTSQWQQNADFPGGFVEAARAVGTPPAATEHWIRNHSYTGLFAVDNLVELPNLHHPVNATGAHLAGVYNMSTTTFTAYTQTGTNWTRQSVNASTTSTPLVYVEVNGTGYLEEYIQYLATGRQRIHLERIYSDPQTHARQALASQWAYAVGDEILMKVGQGGGSTGQNFPGKASGGLFSAQGTTNQTDYVKYRVTNVTVEPVPVTLPGPAIHKDTDHQTTVYTSQVKAQPYHYDSSQGGWVTGAGPLSALHSAQSGSGPVTIGCGLGSLSVPAIYDGESVTYMVVQPRNGSLPTDNETLKVAFGPGVQISGSGANRTIRVDAYGTTLAGTTKVDNFYLEFEVDGVMCHYNLTVTENGTAKVDFKLPSLNPDNPGFVEVQGEELPSTQDPAGTTGGTTGGSSIGTWFRENLWLVLILILVVVAVVIVVVKRRSSGRPAPEPKPKDKGKPEPKTKDKGKPEPKTKDKGKPEPKPKDKGKPEPKTKDKGKPAPKPPATDKKAEAEAKRKAEAEAKRKAAQQAEQAKQDAAKQAQRRAELQQHLKIDAKALKLRGLEEDFELAFNEDDYAQCLELAPAIIAGARELDQPEKVARYEKLQAELETALQRQEEESEHEREVRAQIKQKMQRATKAEDRWKYDAARKEYADIKDLAADINDQLTIDYVDQQLAQIDEWEQEISSFDLNEYTIKPFKILNTRRYDFYEVLPDEKAAEAREKELAAEGYAEENIQIVTIVRSRFKGEGPFNEKGRCWAIYMRHT